MYGYLVEFNSTPAIYLICEEGESHFAPFSYFLFTYLKFETHVINVMSISSFYFALKVKDEMVRGND